MTPGEVHVWRIALDEVRTPEPTPGESARAARFRSAELARRYLRAHGALRAILGTLTTVKLDFALAENGKPWLPHAPELEFNLSHSHGLALVAAAIGVPVGVDVERYRPLPEYAEIADRFFPPSEAPPHDERDFFRCWTRIEAKLKARGVGLYGAGKEIEGEWTVREIDAGEEYAAAVAALQPGMKIEIHDFGAEP